MPRRACDLIDDGTYHVLCKTARGEPVFADPTEMDAFLDILRHVAHRNAWSVLAWCLLPDSYHLAIRTSNIPLPRGMKSLQGRFSQEYNRRHDTSGPLWRGRYDARLVATDPDIAQLVVAIHSLPAAVKDPTGAVCENPTGHRELLGDGEPRTVIDAAAALAAFAPAPAAARTAYATALRDAARAGLRNPDYRTWPWWQRNGSRNSRNRPAQGFEEGKGGPLLTAEEFVHAACAALETTVHRLASRRRDRETVHLRELVTTTGVELFGMHAKDVAKVLNKHPDWVSRWSCRGAERRASDPGYREQIERVASAVRRVAEPPPAAHPEAAPTPDWAAWMG